MKIKLIAITDWAFDPETDDATVVQTDYVSHNIDPWDSSTWISTADELAEFAGRLCYLSWDRPNPRTATNRGYLANIINQQHFSVLEHASATFYLEGVSRSFLNELERHRHLSYSVLSQRYVDHADSDYVPPAIFDDTLDNALQAFHGEATSRYEDAYTVLRDKGYSRKEARGAARAFLLEATETKLVVSGNLRSFREFFQKRVTGSADAEIREVAREMLRLLLLEAPNSLQDLRGLVDE